MMREVLDPPDAPSPVERRRRDTSGLVRTPPRSVSVRPLALLAAVVSIGAALRFAALGAPSLWFDEAWVIWLAGHPARDILHLLRVTDAHPPLYYLLMRTWLRLAGTGEFAARAPSALFGSLSVVLTYAFVRRWAPEPVSLLAAFLTAVSPFAIMAAQEARMYALFGALTVGSTVALLRSVEGQGALRWTLYVVSATLLAYTHYLGLLVLAAHGVWLACFARPRLRVWLLAMAAVALLYLPWLPSLWSQMVRGNGWPWYRRGAAFVDIGDVLGLLAFGGSSFHMGTYFFPGSQRGSVILVVLLPFLVVLACGMRSLRTRPAALGILVLPAGVPLAVMSALSAAGLTFYPRWFSFAAPFFAAALAQGIVEVARSVPRRRDLAAMLIAALLLTYAVPILARYYLDPTFRPYPWRAAASLIRAHAEPDDFFLFVNTAAQVSFLYYCREPHPFLTLIPLEAVSRAVRDPGFTSAQARALAARYRRVWLIATPPFTAAMQERLRTSLTAAYRPAGERTFPAIWIDLLVSRAR